MSLSFTILGHACMLVECNGHRLLVDPWVIGSCYWRSWWHYPKPVEVTPELFNVDAVYITHGHFDHFHYPSLRKFPRSTKIVLARFVTDKMRAGVKSIGFTNIIEARHGSAYTLAGGITLYSYQHGFDDSALVLEAEGRTILNLNDSHVTGLALRQVLKRHPRIDFLFRSHAPAQGYPICYEAEDPAELRFHNRSDYIVRFQNSMRIIRPQYAIPFASNICHLHSETIAFNRYNITPREVAEHCAGPVILMMPGDSWSSTEGFQLSNSDSYRDSEAVIENLSNKARSALTETDKAESTVVPEFPIFRDYMQRFMGALPIGIRLVFRPVIVFDQPRAEHRYWVVDFGRWRIFETDTLPQNANSIIKVHPAVLMDAASKGILYFVHISKRMRVWVKKGGMRGEFKFWGLVQLYETGYLPLRNLLTPRALAVIWRRRAEVLEMGRSAFRGGPFEKKAVPEVY
jgi:UDP-MurNAc hydroxylase